MPTGEARGSATGDCAFVFLTEACNLRCAHCYVSSGPAAGPHMPMSTVRSTLDLLVRTGIRDVRLTGGEPTVHPEFEAIAAMMFAMGLQVGLISNGVILQKRETMLPMLRSLSRCWISLYGPSAPRHAAVSGRPEGTFGDTIEATARLAARGVAAGLSVSVAPGDGKIVESLLEAVAEAGIRRLRLLPLQPDGRARASPIDWAAWPDEIGTMAKAIGSHSLAQAFEVLTINDAFDMAANHRAAGSSCLLHHRRMTSVTPDGSVYPCCFTVYTPQARLGSVHDPDMPARLMHRHADAAEKCRGLSHSFWRGISVKAVSCPISSVDPRTTRTAA